ncbi:hypothetical protein KKP97_07065 [Methanothermococcus sp. SCGC AD-155-C09]|nr:hypothetical protein [Methanothermococcus sp. SCGC AD-155-C09]
MFLTITNDFKRIMWDNVSIIRSEKGLKNALLEINRLKKDLKNIKLNGIVQIQKYFEFKNMLTVAEIIIKCALERKESRGAHYRSDYPKMREDLKGNLLVCGDRMEFIEL